jgi:hypothetical protein
MRKCLVVCAIAALAWVPLRADVTIVTTTTMEGPAAAMMGGQLPKMTQRIKGMKARMDVEVMGQTMIAITDLAEKRVILLQSQTKTGQVITTQSAAAGTSALPKVDADVAFKATGKSQPIDSIACDEYTFTIRLGMAEMAGQGKMPPEAAAMMKDVYMVMQGSMWVAKGAPGASELVAFNKAAIASNLVGAMSGMKPGESGGMDKLMAATASAPGVPYLTEMTMTFEGTGPVVDQMKQMGPMKMIQKASSVSTTAIAEDMFSVPEGYTIDKK